MSLVHKLATLPPNPQKIKIRDKAQKDTKTLIPYFKNQNFYIYIFQRI
jgi:hypothetical protein